MKIIAKIYECSFEDNYNEGEFDGRSNYVEIERRTFSSIEEAINDFKKRYEDSKYGVEFVGDNLIVAPKGMKKGGEYGWNEPTEKEFEAWEVGKISLWNVEIQLKLFKEEEVSDDELEKFFK